MNGFQDSAQGGISFSAPTFVFGQDAPAVNSGYSFDLPMSTIAGFNQVALDFASNNSRANQGFLQGVIDSGQSNVNATGERFFQAQESTTQRITNVGGLFRDIFTNKRFNQSGGCFITTAICEDSNLPDDCDELRTLRGFRDNVMRRRADMLPFIDYYYAIAPGIVAVIKERHDAPEVWAVLRNAYLHPAIEAVKAGEHEKAFNLYRELTEAATAFAAEAYCYG